MGTILKEIAVLDLTETSEDVLKEIKAIKKVALVVYNDKFERFMPTISLEEVAAVVKVPGKFTIVNGKTEINHASALGTSEPLYYIINGKLTIKPDVTPELVERVISGIFINGKIICPENLEGILQQKMTQQNGKVVTYMEGATLLETNSFIINNEYLKQLKDHTNLVALNSVTMTDSIDLDLFEAKINRIQFLSQAVVSKNYQDSLSEKVFGSPTSLIYVTEGYVYIDEDLELDSDELSRYHHAKLFVNGTVSFKEEIEELELNNRIQELKVTETVYCRRELRDSIQKLIDPTTKIRTFTGILRIVNGVHVLSEAELRYSEAPITYVVRGVLEIDSNVDPKMILEKVEKVDLYGVIQGNPEVCGVMQSKLGVKSGYIELEHGQSLEETGSDANETEDTVLSKMALLKL